MTAGGVVPSHRGDAIAILHQYAYLGTGHTIHSFVQLEAYKNKVDDKPIKRGGSQTITTIDGYIHPLNFVHGLPYITIRPFTDQEWKTLPHVLWTWDYIWNPAIVDHDIGTDRK